MILAILSDSENFAPLGRLRPPVCLALVSRPVL